MGELVHSSYYSCWGKTKLQTESEPIIALQYPIVSFGEKIGWVWRSLSIGELIGKSGPSARSSSSDNQRAISAMQ